MARVREAHEGRRANFGHEKSLRNGMLKHSKAESSFVATPATMMAKAKGNLGRKRG